MQTTELEGIVEAMLRGAAKLLGCTSAHLIAFSAEREESLLRIGTLAQSADELGQVEDVLGSIRNASFPFSMIQDSLVFAAWRDRTLFETGSLHELVGTLFPAQVLREAESMIGDHRFLCVPALDETRCPGVMVFEKPGVTPFSPQEREVLVRYARRIAQLVEAGPGTETDDFAPAQWMLVDGDGVVVGASEPPAGAALISPAFRRSLVSRARRMLGGVEARQPRRPGARTDGRVQAEYARVRVHGEELVLVGVRDGRPRQDRAGRQLVRMALGDAGPAVLVDPAFVITSCNHGAERLFGYPPGGLVGRPIRTLFQDPDAARTLLDHQFLFLSDGHFEDEAALRGRDGRLFPARGEALLLADDPGRVLGFVVMIREQSSAQGGRGRTGADALMRRERLATMGEMAAQLAHEVRNPLVAIGATIESVAADLADRADLRDTLAGLQGELTRMDMTLKDYLSMAARHNASVRNVDLREVIVDVIRLLGSSSRGRGARMRCDVPPGLTVLADQDGLRHVFFNLLLNAIDAMPAGGDVRCHSEVAANDVVVHVDDSGPGLSATPAECFEPFFTTKKNGTGLGLAVCRRIVSAHGGAATVSNRRGGGCRASVVLPRRAGGLQ